MLKVNCIWVSFYNILFFKRANITDAEQVNNEGNIMIGRWQ